MSKMRSVMVSYTLKPECVAENEALIREVLADLERERPAGLSYSVSRLSDGVSFVHVSVSPEGVENPLMRVPAFQRYRDGIKDRVLAPPVRVEMLSLGLFDGITQAEVA
ncbi:hypothetical protein VVD49_06125 [Uliginosibacterium sp. H3]|uniref:Antibiotic biosynthesis monooxygenase n=1 Tax=Uliginosibacterium silvisoli TaxID=3114758 RepID=A0ABU6K0U6_9RHOO|nr:hypothetical protein [Uliginosibacterium sp. H3]